MVLNFSPLQSFQSTEDLLLSINKRLSKTAAKNLIKKYKIPKKEWREKSEIILPLEVVNHGLVNPYYQGDQVDIIAEGEDWIAVNKPIKVHTHPLDYQCQNNLLSALASMRRLDAVMVNFSNYDRGALYRLDFETSGVVVLAKKIEFYKNLRDNFHQISKTKKYLAIVTGDIRSYTGEHSHYMKASLKKNHKMIEGDETDFKAILSINNIEYNQSKNLSLVHINLHTGHRHQIRYQLSHLGFPILGDELYGGGHSDRLFLHALEYEFDMGDEKLCLKTGIPNEFEL